MNVHAAHDTIRYSLERLSRTLNKPKGQIEGKYISSDIIMNGALAVIRHRDWQIQMENSRNDSSPMESLQSNLRLITRFTSEVKHNAEYKNIVTAFRDATLLTIQGISSEDASYVEEEIYKVLQNEYGPAEEVLKNYFGQYHRIELFKDKEEDNDDYGYNDEDDDY